LLLRRYFINYAVQTWSYLNDSYPAKVENMVSS